MATLRGVLPRASALRSPQMLVLIWPRGMDAVVTAQQRAVARGWNRVVDTQARIYLSALKRNTPLGHGGGQAGVTHGALRAGWRVDRQGGPGSPVRTIYNTVWDLTFVQKGRQAIDVRRVPPDQRYRLHFFVGSRELVRWHVRKVKPNRFVWRAMAQARRETRKRLRPELRAILEAY